MYISLSHFKDLYMVQMQGQYQGFFSFLDSDGSMNMWLPFIEPPELPQQDLSFLTLGALIKTNLITTITHFLPCAVQLVYPESTSKDHNFSISSVILAIFDALYPSAFSPYKPLIYMKMYGVSQALITLCLHCWFCMQLAVNSEWMI